MGRWRLPLEPTSEAAARACRRHVALYLAALRERFWRLVGAYSRSRQRVCAYFASADGRSRQQSRPGDTGRHRRRVISAARHIMVAVIASCALARLFMAADFFDKLAY